MTLTEAKKQKIWMLKQKGIPIRQIAKKLGVSKDSVCRWGNIPAEPLITRKNISESKYENPQRKQLPLSEPEPYPFRYLGKYEYEPKSNRLHYEGIPVPPLPKKPIRKYPDTQLLEQKRIAQQEKSQIWEQHSENMQELKDYWDGRLQRLQDIIELEQQKEQNNESSEGGDPTPPIPPLTKSEAEGQIQEAFKRKAEIEHATATSKSWDNILDIESEKTALINKRENINFATDILKNAMKWLVGGFTDG